MSSRISIKQSLGAVLIGSIITTAIVVVSIIIFGQLGRFELRVVMSAMVAIGVSLLAFVSVPQIKSHPWFGWGGTSFTALALVLSLAAIWLSSLEFWRVLASAWTLSIVFAYICGLFSREISGWVLAVRKVANGVTLLLAAIVILCIFAPSYVRELTHNTQFKMMGVLGVVAATNALIIFISSWCKSEGTR